MPSLHTIIYTLYFNLYTYAPHSILYTLPSILKNLYTKIFSKKNFHYGFSD